MIASGSVASVLIEVFIAGGLIMAVAFVIRRVALRVEGPWPRRPSDILALVFGRAASPPPPEMPSAPPGPAGPERS